MISIYADNLILTVGVFILLAGPAICRFWAASSQRPVYCARWPPTSRLHLQDPGLAAGGLLPGGDAFAMLVAYAMAFFLAPLSMFQMSVVTIALIFIFQTIFRNLDFLGGVTGMSGIPLMGHLLPITALSVVACGLLLHRLYTSRWGRALDSVEADRTMAGAMGIDVIRMSRVLQLLSGTLGGLAGVIYAFNLGTIHPDVFGFGQLLYCFTIVFVGGRYTPWGPLLMAPVLWLIPEFFPSAIAEFRNIFYGMIVIVALLRVPREW